MYLVLMGAPGAGKGTQAQKLEKELGIPQVSTGDLFRYNLKHETELGNLAQTYINKGELVPDNVTIAMVRERLAQDDCKDGAILDGFPRNPAQADALEELLTEFDGQISLVLYIDVDQDDLVQRLLKRAEIEGRADDNEETIRARMVVFEEQTQPLLDYYGEKGLLVKINGAQSIDDVAQELLEVVRGKI
ncbi:MAG: adenylate kinase [Chloroflexi bacterium]|nr:MAG: adenylate kinase [Chloroflexota bacterium]PIE80134.1 MAG: adenylate kinase [Chloroflexota bacterium]